MNPLDVLFSPDNEYRELNVTGHDEANHIGGEGGVYSKKDKKIEVKMTVSELRVEILNVKQLPLIVFHLTQMQF